jgi:hypothetical protein
MTTLRDRLAEIESALSNLQTLDVGPENPHDRHSFTHSNDHETPSHHHKPSPSARQSLDHRFDRQDPELDAAPVPTPAQEKSDPFDLIQKTQFYDTVAAKFGLGIRDEEAFSEFIVYNAFVTNLRVCPVHLTDSGRYYYIEHRFYLPNTPGVVLRHGTDKEGTCLGVANIPLTGRNSFGLGDFKNAAHEMRWEYLKSTGFWTHMRYEFEYQIANGERKVFHWIRTRNNVLDDQGDLVLIEKEKETEVLAEYVGKGLLKWKKRGRLRIRDMKGWGGDWEKVVLLTWASVIEVCFLPFTFVWIERFLGYGGELEGWANICDVNSYPDVEHE